MKALVLKYKKAIGGAITPGVTYVVVTKLGLSQEVAVALSTVLTGLVVKQLKNIG